MTWMVPLLAIFVIVGLLPPGRMGSGYVAVVTASAVVLALVYVGLGS
jgi:hypothetical protein